MAGKETTTGIALSLAIGLGMGAVFASSAEHDAATIVANAEGCMLAYGDLKNGTVTGTEDQCMANDWAATGRKITNEPFESPGASLQIVHAYITAEQAKSHQFNYADLLVWGAGTMSVAAWFMSREAEGDREDTETLTTDQDAAEADLREPANI